MGKISKRTDSGFIAFDGGVDEYKDPIELDNNRLLSAVNISIDGGQLKKRPGKRLWGPEFTSNFDGVHEYIDPLGVARLLIKSGNDILSVDSEGSDVIDSGLTEEKTYFHSHRGRCWVNGPTTQRKITSDTPAPVGLAAPATAPTVTATGTGLTGDYAWKMTFVIEESGIKIWESNPSPAKELVLTDDSVTLSGVASSDSRVNARYFYRTTAGGAIYQYVARIADNLLVSTVVDSVVDANVGDIVEQTHGVPVLGDIATGANERMFWIDGDKLRYSEQAHTESYQEYQRATSFHVLPNSGQGTGLKRLYDVSSAREDLYIFQKDSTMILPSADPLYPVRILNRNKGCVQQNTIVEFGETLTFLSNSGTVEHLISNTLIDISSHNIPTSLKGLLTTANCNASLINDRLYVLCCRNDLSKLYNHSVWVCDLQTIQETSLGFAKAVWYKWEIDAEYLIQLQDRTILAFDNNSKRIYQLSHEFANDETATAGVFTNIKAEWQTKDFFYGMYNRFKCHYLHLKGNQSNSISIQTMYSDKYRSSNIKTFEFPVDAPFIVGVSVMGSPTTPIPAQLEGPFNQKVAGVWISFKFTKEDKDSHFELTGFQFSYTVFKRI